MATLRPLQSFEKHKEHKLLLLKNKTPLEFDVNELRGTLTDKQFFQIFSFHDKALKLNEEFFHELGQNFSLEVFNTKFKGTSVGKLSAGVGATLVGDDNSVVLRMEVELSKNWGFIDFLLLLFRLPSEGLSVVKENGISTFSSVFKRYLSQ